MINFENENFSDLILNNNLFKDKNEYIKNIQNPVTRLKDTNELIAGAKLAIQQFSDLDVKASAICVVLYRIIEDCDIAITVDDFLQEGYLLREKLDNIDKFESIRWYLSLGLVMAAVELKENRIDKSICLLSQNTQRLYVSSRHGQPFTNVVKSFSALIGIYKYIGFRNEWSEIQLINFLDLYASINIEAFINYKFENQWVYEELSLVFSILYEISKFNALRISNSEKKISELFESFDYLKIPEPFRSLLKKKSLIED